MKEKIYIIFKNNEEEYDDYLDWIIEIYKDKERAEKRFVELVKTNQYKKDRAIKRAKYNEDIGAYRLEEHEIENEKRQDEVIDTNSDSIEEDIKILNHIKAYMQENIDKGYHKFVYNDLGYDEKCIDVINTIEHILSDYKRVLKENEKKDELIERMKRFLLKENKMCDFLESEE